MILATIRPVLERLLRGFFYFYELVPGVLFDFQFRSFCGIARIPYAAGELEQVVELSP